MSSEHLRFWSLTTDNSKLRATAGHVPARCVEPPGRSLEPRSNARPRGMAVPLEQSGGQNSAYRSGCHKLTCFLLLAPTPLQIVTQV